MHKPQQALKAHFQSGKFSAERKFCKMWLADTNFPVGKNFEVENFQLLTMIFSENFSSVEIFLEWKWALITSPTLLYINFMFIFFRIWSTNWSRNWAETWKIVYWRWWNRKFCMMLNAYVVECGYVPPPWTLDCQVPCVMTLNPRKQFRTDRASWFCLGFLP